MKLSPALTERIMQLADCIDGKAVDRSSPAGGPALFADTLSEKDWQRTVTELATARGWRWYHPYDSRKSQSGFPDLTLVHAGFGRLIFAELKTESGKESADQLNWLDDLRATKAEVYVWRPSDWEEVKRVLQAH